MDRARLRQYLLLHFVVVLFGFTGVLGKLITVSSTTLVWYRLLIAVAAIGAYLLWRGVSLRMPRAGAGWSLLVGLIVATHWVCFFESIKQSTVAIGLVCLSTAPFFTALIEPVFFRRRFRAYEVLLGVFTVLGVGFVFRFEGGYQTGILFGLAAGFQGALFTVINGKLVARYDSRSISLYELFSGFVGLSVYLAVVARPGMEAFALSAADAVYLLVLGVVCTAFAFIGLVEVMRDLSPFTVVLAVNLEPIYGILLALVIFRESEYMSGGFYAGAAVILIGIWANAIIKRRAGG